MAEVDPTAAVINGDELTDAPFYVKGADLVERSGLSGRVFFDESAKLFYLQDESGEWRGRDRMTFSTYLKFMGYCPVVRTDKQEKISEIEHVLAHISLNCSVQYAGAIAGFNRGLIINNGQRMLVTREAKIVKPTPGEFPVLYGLICQLFGEGTTDAVNDGPNQLPYFLGWWKHALECLHGKYMDKRCLCMVFAGEAGCGKSLLKDLISLSLGGRECKPYRFMIGQENFNGEFIGSELWVVDDEQASTKNADRSEFGANIKKAVADRYYRIRGMMRDGVVLEMFRVPLICVNREAERLQVLPQLDDDIQDKISVLLAHKHAMPMKVGTSDEKAAFWSTLTEELPHFIYWLMNEYAINEDMFGRFGVTHFHHPDLCADLFHVSREREFWVQVMRVLKKDHFTGHWYWCGKAEDLYELMSAESSPLTRSEINGLPWSTTMGKSLRKISKQFPDRVIQKKIDGCNRWFICEENRVALDAVECERGRVRAGSGRDAGEEDVF